MNPNPSWIAGCIWYGSVAVLLVVGIFFWEGTGKQHWLAKLGISIVTVALFGVLTYRPIVEQYRRERLAQSASLKNDASRNPETKASLALPKPFAQEHIYQKPSTRHERQMSPRKNSSGITANGSNNQLATNSPGSVQQSSTGQNSPNIVGNGNFVGNTFNVDTHIAPTLNDNLQDDLSKTLASFTGSRVILFIHRSNQSTRAFANALVAAMRKDSIDAGIMGEGNEMPEPPPGVSCLVSENRMDFAKSLADFLVIHHLLPTNQLPVTSAQQPDRLDCTIAPW